MKKVLTGLLVLALMLAFVACDSNTKPTPKPEPTPEPTPEGEKQIIYIPGYLQSSTSKGMTGFPDGNPFTSDNWNVGSDHSIYPDPTLPPEIRESINEQLAKVYLASNAMSNLPLLPSMERFEDYPEAVADKLESGNLTVFGFPAEVKASKVNDDGIYLFLEAYEKDSEDKDKTVAIVEYYYSWEDETFSYREIIMSTLMNFTIHLKEDMDIAKPAGNTIILFELYDVPVEEEDGIISFSAGVDVNKKALNPKTAIKQYRVAFPCEKEDPYYLSYFTLGEYHCLLNHTGNLVTGVGYESYEKEYGISTGTFTTLLGDFFASESNRKKYEFTYTPSEEKPLVELSDDKCNIEFCYDILAYFFDGFEAFKDEDDFDERVSQIDSMVKFNALKYTYKSETIENAFRCDGLGKNIYFPVMFNLKDGIGTTADYLSLGLYPKNIYYPSIELEGLSAFNELFELPLTSKDAFAKAILQKCGLSDAEAAKLLPNTSN